MRKLLISLICLTLALSVSLLSGCSKEKDTVSKPYEIVVENGNYYLVWNGEPPQIPDKYYYNPLISGGYLPSISFRSVAEVKNDFETGNFTDEELGILAYYCSDESGKSLICNLSKLYEPILPASFDSLSIGWWGGTHFRYTFYADENEQRGIMEIYTSAEGRQRYDEQVDLAANFAERTDFDVYSETTDSERNGKVCFYTSAGVYEWKKVYYELENDGKILHIEETYALEESSTVPCSIAIYGSDNGIYFAFFLSSFQERPSVDWLCKFGIKLYARD